MNHRLLLHSLIAVSAIIGATTPSVSAESVDELRSRRKALQEELNRVDAEIAKTDKDELKRNLEQKQVRHFVEAFGIYETNSAGGVVPYVTFVNPEVAQTIKYIRVRLTPFNAVGDQVASSIGGHRGVQLQYTGPLKAEDGETRSLWEPVWYNPTIDCLRLDAVTVIFASGATRSFVGGNLRQAIASDLKNDCSYKPK